MKVRIKISGMRCAACASNIEKALNKMEGVDKATVNLLDESATVEFNPEKVSLEDIENKIEGIGFKVVKNKERVRIKIKGMTCAVCAKTIEKFLNKMEGVKAEVNFPDESAEVVFDPNVANIDEIIKRIETLGYKVVGVGEEIDLEKEEKEKEIKDLFNRLVVGAVFSIILFLMMYLNVPYKSYIMFLISIPPLIYVASPIFKAGFHSLKNKTLNMDVMYSMGIGIAYISSLISTIGLLPKEFMFYETAIMLSTFLTLGRYLEARAKSKTSEAIKKLIKLGAKTARVLRDGKEVEVPVDEVMVGDVVIVKPGEKIPVDGVVLEGESYVDESMITGEPIPNLKKENDKVIGGTINKNGVLKIRAERVGKDTLLSQIIKLVKEAQASKPEIQSLADKVVSYFIPVVLAIATLSFIYWYFTEGFLFAVTVFISVLVVACPCALGLATPTAVTVAIGRGAELGILIKNSKVFDLSEKLRFVVFDKTGTLTIGKPVVRHIITDMDVREFLSIVGALEKNSEHPLANAIVKKAEELNVELKKAEKFDTITGRGIIGIVDGKEVLIGKNLIKEKLKELKYEKEIEKLEKEGMTVIVVAINKEVVGIIAISDKIKRYAKETIDMLKDMGIEVYMITGDAKKTAEIIGKQLGIENIFAEVLPNQKAEIVKELKKKGVISFVGDGINDAPALSVSDIGIAIGSGTDIAIESGDIVLVKDDLRYVVGAIKLSRRAMKQIKWNLFWAFAYNTSSIPIAAGLLYPYGIFFKPELAGFAMAMSSVTVVSLSLLLKKYTPIKNNH